MHKESINVIEVFVEGAENARDEFLPTSVIRNLNAAVDLLQCKLFGKVRTINGVAMNKNGIYSIHVDGDATYSIVVVLKSDHSCELEDDVVAHFCFPRLGLAVPMCPGDLLVFNAQEAHCLSSRCNKNDTIYGVAMVCTSNRKSHLSMITTFL